MRTVIFWLLIIAFGWFTFQHRQEVVDISQILLTGDWRWLALVIVFLLGHYLIYARLFQVAFFMVGVPIRLRELFRLLFAALAINVVTPTGGTATTILFMDFASHKGHSSGKAGAGTTLTHLARLVVLSLMTLAIFIYLAMTNRLQLYQEVGSIALMTGFLFFAVFLWLGFRFPVAFHRFVDAFRHLINGLSKPLLRREIVSKEWVELNTAEYSQAAKIMAHNPWPFVEMMGLAFGMYLVDFFAFYAALLAFGQHLPLMAIISTYVIGMLFWVASPTPQGIGVVEGVMTLMLVDYGLSTTMASTVTLAFRGLTFWLPLVIGIAILRTLPSFKRHRA